MQACKERQDAQTLFFGKNSMEDGKLYREWWYWQKIDKHG